MNSQLYIPKRIKVGFQKRTDTFSKKLAYVIYFDDKGILRKEKSWEGWRDKTIEPVEFDNVPQSGLMLNKNVERCSWNWFSTGRTMIRVYDPREIEFEITPENLMGVLMNSDCNKRQLSGEYVYAWAGKELILLPTTCEEYEKAVGYTDLQATKVSVKDLVPGCSYKTRKEEDVVYLGRFFYYQTDYYKPNGKREGKKYHIFQKSGEKKSWEIDYILKTSVDFLAKKNSDEVVLEYAKLIEDFQNNTHSSKIVSIDFVPTEFTDETVEEKVDYYGKKKLKRSGYYTKNGDIVEGIQVSQHSEYKYDEQGKGKYVFNGIYDTSVTTRFNIKTLEMLKGYNDTWYYYNLDCQKKKEELCALQLGDLYVNLENGKRIKVKDQEFYNL